MSKLTTMLSLVKTPWKMVLPLAENGFFKWIPDKPFLQFVYYAQMGKRLDLHNPQTFSEKLQWLKLYDRNPLYTTLVDKNSVKTHVKTIIGDEYIIPTIGLWDRVEDIDITGLPERFVLKCTHDSGSVIICKDKAHFDFEKGKKALRKHLKKNTYWFGREWPYKNVKPRIMAEPYLEDFELADLPDYKIHCCNGEPKFILVCKNRFGDKGLTEDFFDISWNHLDVQRTGLNNSEEDIPCPAELGIMLEKSRLLAHTIPFVRIDFYIVNHKVFFGEMTFFPTSGFKTFVPESFDNQVGNWINIDSLKKR